MIEKLLISIVRNFDPISIPVIPTRKASDGIGINCINTPLT